MPITFTLFLEELTVSKKIILITNDHDYDHYVWPLHPSLDIKSSHTKKTTRTERISITKYNNIDFVLFESSLSIMSSQNNVF